MDPLRKRVAMRQALREILRQSLNDANFKREAPVANLPRKGLGANQEV